MKLFVIRNFRHRLLSRIHPVFSGSQRAVLVYEDHIADSEFEQQLADRDASGTRSADHSLRIREALAYQL